MSRSTQIVIGLVLALALFGGGYTLGSSAAAAKPATAASGAAAGSGAAAAGAARGQGGTGAGGFAQPVNGRVISVNADSITIAVTSRNPGGAAASASPAVTSSIALVGPATRVVRTSETDVKLSDLKAGDQVTVVGSTDQTTGTITAQAVVVGGANILGQLFGGGGGGGGTPQGSGAPRPSASPAR